MLERARDGTFHKMGPKHLNRYVQEFAAKHKIRDEDTICQMRSVLRRMGFPTSGLSSVTVFPVSPERLRSLQNRSVGSASRLTTKSSRGYSNLSCKRLC